MGPTKRVAPKAIKKQRAPEAPDEAKKPPTAEQKEHLRKKSVKAAQRRPRNKGRS
jgi:hypothetical protein